MAKDTTRHFSILRVEPESGLVFGLKGRPFVKRNQCGYVIAKLWGVEARAHRVIWERVYGPVPDGMEINHINGRKDDNRIKNLEVVSKSGNLRHAFKTGLRRADGENNPCAKLTEADVIDIRQRKEKGESEKSIAARYGVSRSTVYICVKRTTWGNVEHAGDSHG